jgi:hypothetical protein
VRKFLIGFILGGAAAIALTTAARNRGEPQASPGVWERMKSAMQDMPEDFPPRVMYDNVENTKANTEEILDLLRVHAAEEATDAPRSV